MTNKTTDIHSREDQAKEMQRVFGMAEKMAEAHLPMSKVEDLITEAYLRGVRAGKAEVKP